MAIKYVRRPFEIAPKNKPFIPYGPRLSGHGTRFGGVIQGAYTVGKILWKNRRFLQGPAIVGTGTGVAGLNAPNNSFDQALRPVPFVQRSRVRYRKPKARFRRRRDTTICCCRRRNCQSHLPRAMGFRRRSTAMY